MFAMHKEINRLIKNLRDEIDIVSPNFLENIKHFSPFMFAINIRGLNKFLFLIEKDGFKLLDKNYGEPEFEIECTKLEFLDIVLTKKLKNNVLKGNVELGIAFFNSILKSKINLEILLSRYLGNDLSYLYTLYNKPKKENYEDIDKLHKRLRVLGIRLDRIEALN